MSENKKDYRVEKDSIGAKDIPQNVYYGVQSLRAAENFHITRSEHASGNYQQPCIYQEGCLRSPTVKLEPAG